MLQLRTGSAGTTIYAPRTISLPTRLGEQVRVGRVSSDIQINAPTVSRSHLLLEYMAPTVPNGAGGSSIQTTNTSTAGVYAVDQGGTNGTGLNGVRMHPQTPMRLEHGHVLVVAVPLRSTGAKRRRQSASLDQTKPAEPQQPVMVPPGACFDIPKVSTPFCFVYDVLIDTPVLSTRSVPLISVAAKRPRSESIGEPSNPAPAATNPQKPSILEDSDSDKDSQPLIPTTAKNALQVRNKREETTQFADSETQADDTQIQTFSRNDQSMIPSTRSNLQDLHHPIQQRANHTAPIEVPGKVVRPSILVDSDSEDGSGAVLHENSVQIAETLDSNHVAPTLPATNPSNAVGATHEVVNVSSPTNSDLSRGNQEPNTVRADAAVVGSSSGASSRPAWIHSILKSMAIGHDVMEDVEEEIVELNVPNAHDEAPQPQELNRVEVSSNPTTTAADAPLSTAVSLCLQTTEIPSTNPTTTHPEPTNQEQIPSPKKLPPVDISQQLKAASHAGASMFSAKILDQLSCSICMECMVGPHVLPCHHAFCGMCIHDWIIQSKHHTCPQCRAPVQPTDMKPNPLVSGILETLETFFSDEEKQSRRDRESAWESIKERERQQKQQQQQQQQRLQNGVSRGRGNYGRGAPVFNNRPVNALGTLQQFFQPARNPFVVQPHAGPGSAGNPIVIGDNAVVIDDNDEDDDDDQDEGDDDDDSDDEDETTHYSYYIEPARSGRSMCRTCQQFIAFRDLRIAVEGQDQEYYHPTTVYHHVMCYAPYLPARVKRDPRGLIGSYHLLTAPMRAAVGE
ncbi:hypothetical protein HDU81_009362 [Chytriomyces hyalinus]|nr:hypothetical protein HDU81_009362 [Chytriomyces hyalinus]